jgi:hypothetical protein
MTQIRVSFSTGKAMRADGKFWMTTQVLMS